jgi:chromosome segregation ATPase
MTLVRKSSAMSDEISQQSHAKFAAISPTLVSKTQTADTKPEKTLSINRRYAVTQETRSTDQQRDITESRALMERYINESRIREERLRETRVEMEKLGTEIRELRERLASSGQEFQKLKAAIAEQGLKLQNQRQDIETQRNQIEKAWERPEAMKLRSEVAKVRNRLDNSETELGKLKTEVQEQNANLRQVSELAAQSRPTLLALPGSQMSFPAYETIAQNAPSIQPTRSQLPKTCINCGSPLEPQDRFCFHCGQQAS